MHKTSGVGSLKLFEQTKSNHNFIYSRIISSHYEVFEPWTAQFPYFSGHSNVNKTRLFETVELFPNTSTLSDINKLISRPGENVYFNIGPCHREQHGNCMT